MQETLTVESPIKINLFFNILERRPDGYHEIETLMAALKIADELIFTRSGNGISLSCNHPEVPLDRSNLIHKAATLLGEEIGGMPSGLHVQIRKNVPVAGGVGGGSSNAALTLSALNRLWNLHLGTDRLHELAARLGSDVNFFLQARPAICTGRGEKILPLKEALPLLTNLHVLLVKPPFGVSTPWAYQRYAKMKNDGRYAEPASLSTLLDSLRKGQCPVRLELFNSLEMPVFEKFPMLEMLKEFLLKSGAVTALMSGSGSTVFGLFTEQHVAENAIPEMKQQFGETLWCQVTQFKV